MAANDAPDIIQMDEKYITEYSNRGALLDLSKYDIDTSKLDEAALNAGKSEDGLTGIAAGINAATILANPAVFKAAGVELPDDRTGPGKTSNASPPRSPQSPRGTYGAAAYGTERPRSASGCARTASRCTPRRQTGLRARHRRVVGFPEGAQREEGRAPASEVVEAEAAPLDQSGLATGKNGLAFWWSNQLPALEKAAGGDLQILRFPSKTGNAADAKLWYKASQFWSASSRTKHPEETAKFINFLANNAKAGEALLADRGVHPNSDVRAAIAAKADPGRHQGGRLHRPDQGRTR